jgi:hypothetical protein
MLAPVAPYPAGLLEHHSQGQTCVRAMVAMAAAHWILKQEQPFHVFHTEA